MKKILVTGAEGFIGKKLVRNLKKSGHSVFTLTSSSGDIASPDTLLPFYNAGIDFIFHLAGRTFIPDSWSAPADFFRTNITGTLNILELCRMESIPLTFISAYLYGTPESLPVKEDHKINPNNPYAMSKYQAELLCQYYAQFFDISLTIIRPFNIYGPGQKDYFLIPEIIKQAKSGNEIRLKDLTPKRDYLYLDDLIEALLLTLGLKPGFRIYNIGSGSSLSIHDIVNIVQTVLGTSLPVICENNIRQNEIADVYADSNKARLELDWQPRFSFEEGIKTMLRNEEHAT